MKYKVIYLDSKDEERELVMSSELEAMKARRELRKKGSKYVEIVQLDKRYTPPKKYDQGAVSKKDNAFEQYHIRGTLADVMK